MTKGHRAYGLRTNGDRLTWAEIAAAVGSTEEGARRVARHHARVNRLPLPERYGDETRRAAAAVVPHATRVAVEELADELRVSPERVADLARRHARANNLPFPPSLAHPDITSTTAPADAYRMGVVEQTPWPTVATALGYRTGKSAQSVAREHARTHGLPYRYADRGQWSRRDRAA